MTDRRSFVGWVASVAAAVGRPGARAVGAPPVLIEAQPTALYQQPDGRNNLVRITVSGLDAPAARARVTDRRGALVGTAGLLPTGGGAAFAGEVWVPLSVPSDFQIDVEVGKQRVARRKVRLAPPRRWTLYWLSSNHTDVGYTDLQERCLEIHRKNLDAALARLAAHPDCRWTAECALQVISYVENRSAAAGDALTQAIRDGKVGFSVLFANMLTGILDHETFARLVWPAGLFARQRGLGYSSAQITDVPGQALTFPMVLAASGVRYLASGPNPERAVPLLLESEAAGSKLTGEWTTYPQLYWWEGPDGSRVLHWRGYHHGDALRFGFDVGPEEMARRLSDWLLVNPVLRSPGYPYDVALLYGAQRDNALIDERLIDHLEEFRRRYAFPRIVPGRAEDFFRDVERRFGPKLPVRRGDTGLYWEDGAASTAAELAHYRAAQLAARAVELLALWDERTETGDAAGAERVRRRAEERRQIWRDLLLFGEHTWGAAESISDPDGRKTVAQWDYKRHLLDRAVAAFREQLDAALLRIGHAGAAGPGRVVFNASSWPRTDVVRVPDGGGRRLAANGHDLPTVDLADGSALVVVRDVPALGYLTLTASERAPNPPQDEGPALEAQAGGFRVVLHSATGAIRSLTGDGGGGSPERVKPGTWSGLNELVYVTGGSRTALWTDWAREALATPADLSLATARLDSARRERLPGIGARLVIVRRLPGFSAVTSIVTLYDELTWIDIENRFTKDPTLEKEALYVAFPFAFAKPTVELEVPLGRMTVERDQQPGSCRDWYCHSHWVWLREGAAGGGGVGVLWSGPDTPLVTLNDIFRGQWRRKIAPDGTLFAYVMNNYWHTNYAARQGGEYACRFRVSLLGPGDPAEPVRRGWAACDPLYVSAPYTSSGVGPLAGRDSAVFIADQGVLVVGAKPADDGDGAIVKLLDVAGAARRVPVGPAAYRFQKARRTNLVEMNLEAIPVAQDRRATLQLPAWGLAAARLFTPREAAG